jgi:hypothetical protein
MKGYSLGGLLRMLREDRGVTLGFQQEVSETIEGNTNDSGECEGFEVHACPRSYTGKNFIRLV